MAGDPAEIAEKLKKVVLGEAERAPMVRQCAHTVGKLFVSGKRLPFSVAIRFGDRVEVRLTQDEGGSSKKCRNVQAANKARSKVEILLAAIGMEIKDEIESVTFSKAAPTITVLAGGKTIIL